MTLRKVPSQAASGADTFSDNLVGVQITTGTGQLTNTNFSLDGEVIQRDTKNFKTNPFSEFLTLDDLKLENELLSNDEIAKRKKEIRFKGSKNDASKSLFGSLKSRLGIATQNIVLNFPAAILIDSNSLISSDGLTASNIIYSNTTNTTQFDVLFSMLYNPFSIVTITPNSKDNKSSVSLIRDFYNTYQKYVISINNINYKILSYNEPNQNNIIKLKVEGKPFTGDTYSSDILIRPNDGIVEEFYRGLDDLEESLVNRETSPIYTASFKVPRDSFDQSKTELISVNYTWPLSEKDNWNIKIEGLDYQSYLTDLSDIADEIDDYKSNLFIRFLTSPQLFEFDSPDKKAESIFQLYGQSFDKVKKYIDNIAYMRNVSYDGVNNVPDILLKNLANTLGLDTVNLIDEKTIDELLYTKTSQQYSGLVSGTSLLDAEYEFYRRLLVNLAHIYKSKGTRQSLEFFLRFLGAPEPMIKINQYVYKVKSYPKSFNLEDDIFNATVGKYTVTTATFNTTSYSYSAVTTSGSTSLSVEGYPVNSTTFKPKSITGSTELFFQKGSGWYDNTKDHKSPLVIDEELSSGTTINDKFVLTGRTKTSITKNSPFTYGEDYFDVYRTLPGLDTGYELEAIIDNTKTELVDDESHLILNRKNIEIYLSSAQAIDYDIYRKSRDFELTFGTNSLTPQTGVTFAEYVDLMLHQQIKNSNVIKYRKNYITLEDIFQDYISQTGFTPYSFPDVNLFIEKMSPYWTSVIDQIIPSTTLWTGGNLISNNIFGRPKYQYKYGCQPVEIIDNLYPEIPSGYTQYFEDVIDEYDNSIRGEVNELGEYKYDGNILIFPTFEINGNFYSGTTGNTSTITGLTGSNLTYVIVSGKTNSSISAKLFQDDGSGSDYALTTGTTNTVNPGYEGYEKIKELWKFAVLNTIQYINQYSNSGLTVDNYGYISSYAPFTGATGITLTPTNVRKKLLIGNIFTDNNGNEKIKLTSFKYGPNDCSNEIFLDLNARPFTDIYDCTFSGCTATYFQGPTPTPTNTPIPTATPTTTPSPTPTPLPATATPTATPTPLPATATPTVTPIPATDTPTPTPSPAPATYTPTPTSTPTPTPTPDCNFNVELIIVTSTPTPTPTNTPTPTPTPDCNFNVDLTIITSTPTPTPTSTPTPSPTPDCNFNVDLTIITSTPTPTPTNTPTPSPTPDCNFNVDLVVITSTPTPSPTPTNEPTPTPSPTPTLDCNFNVDLTIITSTPTPTPTSTLTPTSTPDCNFNVDVIVENSTPTPTPAPTGTPTPTPTSTPEPATYTPTPTNTTAPSPATYTPTPTSTTTPEPATDTPTPTPTPTPVSCECLTVYNESGDRSIIFQYNRCSDGSLVSLSVPSGSNRTVCVQEGTDITDVSGLLTSVASGTPCAVNGDCTNPSTSTPTPVPTNVPTNIPTNVPTNIPTNVPTNVPTLEPTATPLPTDTPTPTPLPPTDTPTPTPLPPTDTPTPTPLPTDTPTPTPLPTDTPTPTPLPEGVLNFGSTIDGVNQCGFGFGPNDYEYYITYYVNFTSARNMMGYVVVILNDNSTITIPFNQNDTLASTTIFCGCGSSCADIQEVMSILYTTPTPTPEPEPTLEPTNPPSQCWQYGFSGTIYNSQSECQDAEGGPCSEVLCPEGPQP
jgi:hypothetical protein